MVKLRLKKGSKVYVVAPAGVVTGGPEDLYQIAENLRGLFPHIQVYMYYIDRPGMDNPVAEPYAHFGIERAMDIEDSENNVLILPEKYTTKLGELTHIQKVVWWLSLDNYYFSPSISNRKRWFNSMMLRRFGSQHFMFMDKAQLKTILWHMTQSYRAHLHLMRKGIPHVYHMADHVVPEFANYKINESIKEDIVVYNSKQGLAFTQKLIATSPDITFISISPTDRRLSDEDQRALLARAKVYIDLGHHPGGQRLPKEAALHGCCVITSKKGSANCFDDVPIPPDFKFNQNFFIRPLAMYRIRQKIKECFNDYHSQVRRFRAFRERARTDYQQHLDDIRYLFVYEE